MNREPGQAVCGTILILTGLILSEGLDRKGMLKSLRRTAGNDRDIQDAGRR